MLFSIFTLLLLKTITEQIAAMTSYFINDFAATLFFHLDFCSYSYKVLKGRMPRSVDRGRVFTIVPLCAEREVVGWCQYPSP